MASNKTVTPKWKERTDSTNKKHLNILSKRNFDVMFIGDSMFERWFTTGSNLWNNLRKYNIMNCGIGGDKVENLLWRFSQDQNILAKPVNKIFLMIGTNNIDTDKPELVYNGIENLVKILIEKMPNAKLYLYGILPKNDNNKKVEEKINICNQLLAELCKSWNLEYRYFGDKVNNPKFFDDHVHLNVDGYQIWYDELLKDL